jgi:hypothetical protein
MLQHTDYVDRLDSNSNNREYNEMIQQNQWKN